ncbi:DsbA family protein [Candidatus Gracilibacteria bacterium]|nr:DsbA family protein [Candidatus Gracilibacteria bacterium]
MKKQDSTLSLAIIISALIIGGSLVFFGLQLSGNKSPEISEEILAENIEQGVANFIEKQKQGTQQEAIVKAQKLKPVSKNDHLRGNREAVITIVEYSDLECPFCKSFHPTMKKVLETYPDKVNWVYRHFPLPFHNPLATQEALASECANKLGGNDKFWEYIDLVYANTTSNGKGLEIEELPKMAEEIGLDQDKFQKCLVAEEFKSHVQKDSSEGGQAGVSGTPGNFFVNNLTKEIIPIPGALPFSQLQSLIDNVVNK